MSGRFLAMFDPHCDVLTGVDASNPGLRIEFTKHAVATTHPAQFAGFMLFGCDMKAPFDGTLFRFPLRTGAQAAVSRLSKQAHSVDNMRAMLRGFAREACDCMLFLKAVQRIEVYEHIPGATEPTRLFVTTVQCTPEGRVERNAFTRLTAAAASTSSSTTQATSVYTAQFRTESEPGSDISCDVSVTYLFSQALGGGRSQAVAQAGQHQHRGHAGVGPRAAAHRVVDERQDLDRVRARAEGQLEAADRRVERRPQRRPRQLPLRRGHTRGEGAPSGEAGAVRATPHHAHPLTVRQSSVVDTKLRALLKNTSAGAAGSGVGASNVKPMQSSSAAHHTAASTKV